MSGLNEALRNLARQVEIKLTVLIQNNRIPTGIYALEASITR